VTWRVPSLSLADEAIELFTDRARRARPQFTFTRRQCVGRDRHLPPPRRHARWRSRLAAARVRALSPAEILDSLRDRFRLAHRRRSYCTAPSTDIACVGGLVARAVDRARTRSVSAGSVSSRAGSTWRPPKAVGGGTEVERYQLLDQLGLLVDKSLVGRRENRGAMRYRCWRRSANYAQEKLGESGEADVVRVRHRDYYTAMAVAARSPAQTRPGAVPRACRNPKSTTCAGAFAWSRESADTELALAAGLRHCTPLWRAAGAACRKGWPGSRPPSRTRPAPQSAVAPAVRARALADKAMLDSLVGASGSIDHAEEALTIPSIWHSGTRNYHLLRIPSRGDIRPTVTHLP